MLKLWAFFASFGLVMTGSAARAQGFSSAKEAFAYLHQVATHPRCVNCHGKVREDGKHIPTVGDDRRDHPMNIQIGIADLGTKCTACHQRENFAQPVKPPGAANDDMPDFLWHMPDRSMMIDPKTTPRQLCEQWLDPRRNGIEVRRGGRSDMATFKREFMHHFEHDPLIHWVFEPGPGRRPAPGSKEKLIEAARVWIEADAPCE